MQAYGASLDHLLAELDRLDLLIRFQVWRVRQRADADQGLRAAYIAEEEPEQLLDRVAGTPAWDAVPLPPELVKAVQGRLDDLSETIERRTAASLAAGVPLRLAALAGLFELGSFEVDVVLACLAPELDARYERLYAYLHDDLTRRQPTAGLVLDLLFPSIDDRIAARRLLSPQAPLRKHHLVQSGDDLRLDPRVVAFLLEDDGVDERLGSAARVVVPEGGLGELTLPAELRDRLTGLMRPARDAGDLVLYLQGSYGVGRQSVAAACCAVLGINLLVVDGARLAAARADEFKLAVRLADREARLQGAVLLWQGFDALLAEDRQAQLAALLQVLDEHPGPVFLSGEAVWKPRRARQQAVRPAGAAAAGHRRPRGAVAGGAGRRRCQQAGPAGGGEHVPADRRPDPGRRGNCPRAGPRQGPGGADGNSGRSAGGLPAAVEPQARRAGAEDDAAFRLGRSDPAGGPDGAAARDLQPRPVPRAGLRRRGASTPSWRSARG